MYERFTDRAKAVMQLANKEAQRLKHDYIGSEHILLGLLKEGSGVAVQVLKNRNLDPQKIVREIDRLILASPSVEEMGKYFDTPRAKKVIEYAMEEARNFKHGHVGTEHILLGLLREEEGVAGGILKAFGLRAEETRREIERVLQQPYDWGRKLPLPQFPTQWAAMARRNDAGLPQACPKCGHTPVVHIIWERDCLSHEDLEDITAGRAILGSPSAPGGPPWVCLRCVPRWSEVHRLAMQDHELQVQKEAAIGSQEFDKAAQCRDAQEGLQRQLALLLDELSRNE